MTLLEFFGGSEVATLLGTGGAAVFFPSWSVAENAGIVQYPSSVKENEVPIEGVACTIAIGKGVAMSVAAAEAGVATSGPLALVGLGAYSVTSAADKAADRQLSTPLANFFELLFPLKAGFETTSITSGAGQ